MKARVKIKKGHCSMCARYGRKHIIYIASTTDDPGGYRLTPGCKATFGRGWKHVTNPKERAPWVKEYWRLRDSRERPAPTKGRGG